MDLYQLAHDIFTNPKHAKWIAALLFLADTCLCFLIIWRVPYTEIDWTTYMQQVSLYQSGERDYTKIEGDTGPLVYPAGHVYVYSLLYNVTDGGRDILLGQILFAILYLLTLFIVMACYVRAQAPPYLFPLLILSKRLHSVYVLRLFNDGVAALTMWTTIFLFQKGYPLAGVIAWTSGVSIKMSLLLLAPAIAVIVALTGGIHSSIRLGIVAILVQALLATPFLQKNPIGYASRAFELTRQFLFKWTVNWRFIGEGVFLSKSFSTSLLVIHISLLYLYLTRRWLRPSRCGLWAFIPRFIRGELPTMALSDSFVMKTILTSLVIGLLCARSLHYQFFAYLSWASPFLFWKAGFHPAVGYIMWAVQEWAWNIFPSTSKSSMAVVFCLAIQVAGVLPNSTDG